MISIWNNNNNNNNNKDNNKDNNNTSELQSIGVYTDYVYNVQSTSVRKV